MKKLLLILGLSMFMFSSFAKPVVVVSVTREGNHWLNLFNCYGLVDTKLVETVNGVPHVSLRCEGTGFNFCRPSRHIGEQYASRDGSNVLSNPAILNAIDELMEMSESKVCTKGTYSGTASKKVAIASQTKAAPDLYFVNAKWTFDKKNPSAGTMTITIEKDESNILDHRVN